jgi:uncharacterized protein with von Willebrand factor type A (vWA) domain
MSTLPDNATEPMQKAMLHAVMLHKSMNDVWRAALRELPEPADDRRIKAGHTHELEDIVQRKQAPLTDEQITAAFNEAMAKRPKEASNAETDRQFVRAIEAAHGIGAAPQAAQPQASDYIVDASKMNGLKGLYK